VVGRGYGDDVDIFRFEHATEIALGFWRVAKHLLRLGCKPGQDTGVDVADVGNAGSLAIGLERREMRIASAVEAVDGEVQAVVGAEDLRIAFASTAIPAARPFTNCRREIILISDSLSKCFG
jgi:hypothetical protein